MSQHQIIECNLDPAQFPGLDVYAVAGNPIAHSKSPTIHKRFAEQSQQAIHYGRLQPALDDFETAAKVFLLPAARG